MNLTILAALISAGVAGIAGWGAAWTLQGRTIDGMKLEARDERITQQRAARQTAERLTSAVSQAQEDAQRRAADLERDLDRSRDELTRLRDTSASAVRVATDSHATCVATIRTYDVIFSECSGTVQTMARDVDKCISDNQALISAWPKNKTHQSQ